MARDSRVGALDGIRALAVLGVFACHTIPHLGGAALGVQMFFVLSGYLITTLLLAEWEATGAINLRNFYMRRALRLYPALLVVILIAAPLFVWSGTPPLEYLRHAAVAGLYLQDIPMGLWGDFGPLPHTWSLAIEEQFYLLWPPVLILALRRRWPLPRMLLATVLVGATLLIAWPGDGVEPNWHYLPWTQAPVLLAGCLLAITTSRGWRLRGVNPTALAFAGLTACGVLALIAPRWADLDHDGITYPLTALATVAVVYGVREAPEGPAARLLSLRPLAWLGLRSYGFYLICIPAIELVGHLDARRSLGTSLAFVASLVLCALSYRYVEKPFLLLKRRWESQGERGALTTRHSLVPQA